MASGGHGRGFSAIWSKPETPATRCSCSSDAAPSPKALEAEPDEIALCVETFSSVAGDVVRAGDLLPGDHPLVQAHLQYFAPDGTPPEELAVAVPAGDREPRVPERPCW
jgi:hypothetical protein